MNAPVKITPVAYAPASCPAQAHWLYNTSAEPVNPTLESRDRPRLWCTPQRTKIPAKSRPLIHSLFALVAYLVYGG
jgi:hypothetical protein